MTAVKCFQKEHPPGIYPCVCVCVHGQYAQNWPMRKMQMACEMKKCRGRNSGHNEGCVMAAKKRFN